MIGALILLLLIPLAMIRGLITERQYTAYEAGNEVQEKWSSAQQVVGPFISIPYYENGKTLLMKTVKVKEKL